jgi:zinc finger-like protein
MDSPLAGMHYIHEAILRELAAMEDAARDLATGARGDAAAVRERFEFLHEVTRGHAQGEDEIIFAAIDERVFHAATQSYHFEHNAEAEVYADIATLLAVLTAAPGAEDRRQAAQRLYRQTVALNTILSLHMRKEESQLIPLAAQHFTVEEQAVLSARSVQAYSPELLAKAIPWLLERLNPEERVEFVLMMEEMMPPPAFQGFAGMVARGVQPPLWQELTEKVPELAQAAP